jgi:hypothetical protein
VAAGGTVGETAEGFTPLSLEEALALVSEDLAGVDRDALLAERAEAEAQLRAAEATLEQEREEPTQKPLNVEVQDGSAEALDREALRLAAAQARAADDELARAASEASERPLPGEVQLGTAESAFARALEIREELPATWRRLVGALISATGMAIVVGALGWSVYWLLVPIALIAILTVDLRLAGKAARETSDEAALALASVGGGGVGVDELERVRMQRTRTDDTEGRLNAARVERDAAYARFEELAPGRRPSEVDEIIAELEAEQAVRAQARAAADAARAEAEAEAAAAQEAEERAEADAEAARAEAAEAEPEPEAEAAEAEGAPVETDAAAEAEPAEATEVEVAIEAPAAVTASEWWFGTKDAPEAPAAAAAPVKALAERLSAEGREALARIQAQLDALDRVELAKKSLEWHETNGSTQRADTSENA